MRKYNSFLADEGQLRRRGRAQPHGRGAAGAPPQRQPGGRAAGTALRARRGAAGNAPLKAVGPPPALHMEGARSERAFCIQTTHQTPQAPPRLPAPLRPRLPPLPAQAHTPRAAGQRARSAGEGKGKAGISKRKEAPAKPWSASASGQESPRRPAAGCSIPGQRSPPRSRHGLRCNALGPCLAADAPVSAVPPPERPPLPPPARPRPPARSARARAGERGRCRSPAREPPPRRQRSSRPPSSSSSSSAAPPSRDEPSPAAALPASVCGERGGGRQLEPGEGDRQPGGKSRPLCAVSPRPALPLPPARAGNPRRSPLLSRLLPITEGGPGTAAQRAGGSRGPGLPWPLAPAAPDAAVTPLPRARLGRRGPAPSEGDAGWAAGHGASRSGCGVVPAEPWGLGRRAGAAAGHWGKERLGGWRRDAGLRESGSGAAESRSLPLPVPREMQQPRSKRRREHNSVHKTKKMPLGRMGGREGGKTAAGRGRRVWKRSGKSSEPEPLALRESPVGAPRQPPAVGASPASRRRAGGGGVFPARPPGLREAPESPPQASGERGRRWQPREPVAPGNQVK